MKILMLLFILFVVSCSHLQEDIGPSPADHNYRRMEFTTNLDGKRIKEVGTSNISIKEGESIDNYGVTIHAYNTGKLIISSRGCLFSELFTRYEGNTYIPLSSIIPESSVEFRCLFDLVISPDQVSEDEDKAHNIKMIGRILVNFIPKHYKKAGVEYIQANSSNNGSYLKHYKYDGQGSIQLLEGKVSKYIGFNLILPSQKGEYILTGCGFSKPTIFPYTSNITNITFKKVFGKEEIKTTDSCLLEINVVPEDVGSGFMARFDLNVYGKAIIRLEEPKIYIDEGTFGDDLVVKSMPYVIVQSINDKVCTDTTCEVDYERHKEYWIRTITKNGRYRVLSFKNGRIHWRE